MVFYLSCTGNTRWAALQAGHSLGERTYDIALESPGDCSYQLKPGETVGFCFPVHAWRPPLLMRDFIAKLHITGAENAYCWMLCTAGDDIGESVDILNHDLQPLGLKTMSAWSLQMPNTYVGLPLMDVDSAEVTQRKLSQASEDLETIVRQIAGRTKGATPRHLSRWPRVNSRFLGGLFVRHLLDDHPFHADAAKCTRCGRCVRSCPVGNLASDESGQPLWLHSDRCLCCFACYHHCPTHAISYGHRTQGKGQYHYPDSQKQPIQ